MLLRATAKDHKMIPTTNKKPLRLRDEGVLRGTTLIGGLLRRVERLPLLAC